MDAVRLSFLAARWLVQYILIAKNCLFHYISCICTLADFYWSGCAQGNIGGRSALWLLRMDWKGKILTGDVSRVPSSKFVNKPSLGHYLLTSPVARHYRRYCARSEYGRYYTADLHIDLWTQGTHWIQLEVVSFLKTSECLPHRCYVSRFLLVGRAKLRGRRIMEIAARPQELQGKSLIKTPNSGVMPANTILNLGMCGNPNEVETRGIWKYGKLEMILTWKIIPLSCATTYMNLIRATFHIYSPLTGNDHTWRILT